MSFIESTSTFLKQGSCISTSAIRPLLSYTYFFCGSPNKLCSCTCSLIDYGATVIVLVQGWEPIYYHGPHQLCMTAGGPQNQRIFVKIQPLSNYEEEWLLMTYYLSTCLSWIIVSTRRTLTWVTKILLRAISNVHPGRIWPAGRRFPTLYQVFTSAIVLTSIGQVL